MSVSGLAALLHRDGRPVDADAIWAMLSVVPYRGPDGRFVRVWPNAGLGQAKMAVTPEEEAEHQPLVSPRTGCSIICDVRLDNRRELLARLPNRPASSASDAELILLAYEAWDTDVATHLLGDFAFVIWDPRHQRLVSARDSSGQRTLFYRFDDRTFAAASEIHQLFQDASVAIQPDDAAIREFLVPLITAENMRDAGPRTFFAGIWAIPAGHALAVDREGLRVWRYWDLKPPAEIRYTDDEAYAEHFLALFSEIVEARLRSSRPIGALLSGGLDSTSVVCTAQELYRRGRAPERGFLALSLVFDGLECDESQYIAATRAKYGFAIRDVPPPPATDRLQLEPAGFQESPNASNIRVCDPALELASQQGVRAVLTGDVADACLLGSRLVFDSLIRQGKLREFCGHLRTYRRLSTSESLRNIVALYCVTPLLPRSLQQAVNSTYLRRVFNRSWGLIAPHWLAEPLRTSSEQRYLEILLEREHQRRFSSPARQAEFDELYPPDAAPHPSPWPIEIWRPFADRRLHEFLFAIPPEQKFAPHPESDDLYAGGKSILRRAMRGIVPETVRTRTTKTHFGSFFRDELRRRWADYEAVFGPRGGSEIVKRGYVDQQAFLSRLQRLRDGTEGGDLLHLMRVVGLETWLRTVARQCATTPTDMERHTRSSAVDKDLRQLQEHVA